MAGEPQPHTAQPTPEFDEATLLAAGRLAIALGRNKETGRPFRALVKKIDPTRTFPADDVADLREELAERDRKTKEKADHDRVINAIEAQRKNVAGRYTDDEMKEIDKIMEKAGLTDYEIGEELYLSRRKPAAARDAALSNGRTWEFPQADGLFENPQKWATDEAVKVIDEIKTGVFRP